MPRSIMTENGLITVPKEIRDTLEIKPGQRLEWTINTDGTVSVTRQASALPVSSPPARKTVRISNGTATGSGRTSRRKTS